MMPCINNLVFLVLKPVPISIFASLLSRLLMWWSILLSSCFAKEDIISGLDVVQGHRLGARLCWAPEQNNDYLYQLQSKTVELLFICRCSWSSGQPYITKYIANVCRGETHKWIRKTCASYGSTCLMSYRWKVTCLLSLVDVLVRLLFY